MNPIQIEHDFRYPNTLRLNFNVPVGMGIDGEEDDMEEFHQTFPTTDPEVIYDLVGDTITTFCQDFDLDEEIDWRDFNEVEIHYTEIPLFNPQELVDVLLEELNKYAGK